VLILTPTAKPLLACFAVDATEKRDDGELCKASVVFVVSGTVATAGVTECFCSRGRLVDVLL
jgi:hypothetical protein